MDATPLLGQRIRRPLLGLTGSAVLAEALFVVYALVGIDDLSQDYIGLFSWSIPLSLILVVLALAGDGVDLRSEGLQTLPQTLADIERTAAGRPLALDIGPGAGPFTEGMGLLVHLERDGTSVCVLNTELTVTVRSQRMCRPDDQEDRVRVEPYEAGSRPDRSFPRGALRHHHGSYPPSAVLR